jgi:hypothetical protein
MGKKSRLRMLGETHDHPREGKSVIQLKKERRISNEKLSLKLQDKHFWENLGFEMDKDGSLRPKQSS